jgi:hypothetical protein
MVTKNNFLKYLRIPLFFVVAYLTSVVAWWWQHDSTLFSGRPIELWFYHIALLLNLPGWVIVSGFYDNQSAQLAVKHPELLVPLLSGIIWGFLALLVLKSSRLVMK